MDISLTSVLGQVINFAILFFLFRKFLTKPIVKAIEERRTLIKKLEGADLAYDKRMEEARQESDVVIQEGLRKKENLIAEAGVLATKRKDEILKEARLKANDIIKEAESKNNNLELELKNNFANGVKQTSLSVLKKLFTKDKQFQSAYLDEIVSEITK